MNCVFGNFLFSMFMNGIELFLFMYIVGLLKKVWLVLLMVWVSYGVIVGVFQLVEVFFRFRVICVLFGGLCSSVFFSSLLQVLLLVVGGRCSDSFIEVCGCSMLLVDFSGGMLFMLVIDRVGCQVWLSISLVRFLFIGCRLLIIGNFLKILVLIILVVCLVCFRCLVGILMFMLLIRIWLVFWFLMCDSSWCSRWKLDGIMLEVLLECMFLLSIFMVKLLLVRLCSEVVYYSWLQLVQFEFRQIISDGLLMCLVRWLMYVGRLQLLDFLQVLISIMQWVCGRFWVCSVSIVVSELKMVQLLFVLSWLYSLLLCRIGVYGLRLLFQLVIFGCLFRWLQSRMVLLLVLVLVVGIFRKISGVWFFRCIILIFRLGSCWVLVQFFISVIVCFMQLFCI